MMAWLRLNVLEISEIRWPREDYYTSDGFRIIHSGGEGNKE